MQIALATIALVAGCAAPRVVVDGDYSGCIEVIHTGTGKHRVAEVRQLGVRVQTQARLEELLLADPDARPLVEASRARRSVARALLAIGFALLPVYPVGIGLLSARPDRPELGAVTAAAGLAAAVGALVAGGALGLSAAGRESAAVGRYDEDAARSGCPVTR